MARNRLVAARTIGLIDMWLKIFSYGSNMCARRMLQRVPSLRVIGAAQLAGHELRFHKRGLDGSGKADAYCTNLEEHVVWGVLAEIHSRDKTTLDQAESLGVGYENRTVTVRQSNGSACQALIYAALPNMIDLRLHPFRWYLDLVLAGAREYALPAPYIQRLANTFAISDPDVERDRCHRRLLTEPD